MRTLVEFKVIEDIDHHGDIVFYVHADKDLIRICYSLRRAMGGIKNYIKGLEKKRKENLPRVIYTDLYEYDDGR